MAERPASGGKEGTALRVEVAYAAREKQVLIALEVPPGTTVREAIARSGITARIREIVIAPERVGIFGKLVELDALVCDGNRVEIYRPLLIDPKEARRRRGKRRR